LESLVSRSAFGRFILAVFRCVSASPMRGELKSWITRCFGDRVHFCGYICKGCERGVSDVVFSPDGRYVATAGNDKTARVLEATTGKEISRVTHDDIVHTLAFTPDGRYVATGSQDQTARVFEAATGNRSYGCALTFMTLVSRRLRSVPTGSSSPRLATRPPGCSKLRPPKKSGD
jgi:WD40 repeat protein